MIEGREGREEKVERVGYREGKREGGDWGKGVIMRRGERKGGMEERKCWRN